MKILIADDVVISCKDLEKHLIERNYEGVTPRNGNEAWEFTAFHTCRLAIFDWNMPVSDGIERKYV